VAGRKRVPSPAAGRTALRTVIDDISRILCDGMRKVKDSTSTAAVPNDHARHEKALYIDGCGPYNSPVFSGSS
jgi:hypothetical protein